MSALALLLVFAGIPLVVIGGVFALVYGLSRRTDRHDGQPDDRVDGR